MTATFRHVTPQVGPHDVRLFDPADVLYERIHAREELRLIGLRHLGALSHALPGTRHSRWDYTVALLYYCQNLKLSGLQSKFRLGDARFSSAIAALQVIALAWNVGHLPGTQSTEKGVYRFLYAQRSGAPASVLNWPHAGNDEVERVREAANRFLLSAGAGGLARVLGVVKLLELTQPGDTIWAMVVDFLAPFLLAYESVHSSQWQKLNRAWTLVRHLAYLTIDGPLSGARWAPSIPVLVTEASRDGTRELDDFADELSEILSPIERMTYERLYFREEARIESAWVAARVEQLLGDSADPAALVASWLQVSLFQKLKLGRRDDVHHLRIAGSVRIRSHLTPVPDSLIEIERRLKNTGVEYPIAQEYIAWNSSSMLEPNELVIDIINQRAPSTNDVGRALIWLSNEFDHGDVTPDDDYRMLRKSDLGRPYHELLSKAFSLHVPGCVLRVDPWPLEEFGLLKPYGEAHGIWMTGTTLDAPLLRYFVRDRSRSVSPDLQMRYAELGGIRKLRVWLRRKVAPNQRVRWFVLLGGVRLSRDGRDLIEFDGGLVSISSRSGALRFYGLESKTGAENPARSLQRRLRVLGIEHSVTPIDSDHAFAQISV